MRHAHTISLTIHTGNAAFDDHEGGEVARILRHLARTVSQYKTLPETGDDTPGSTTATAHDLNGNKVGRLVIIRDD